MVEEDKSLPHKTGEHKKYKEDNRGMYNTWGHDEDTMMCLELRRTQLPPRRIIV